MLQPVIIAGGSGTRLWPLSRQLYPKQFLPLVGNLTMLQVTLQRIASLDCLPPIIVCNEEHRFIAAEQLRALDMRHGGIILEPAGRNTAPAIFLAALLSQDIDPEAPLLVLPADHHMSSPEVFCAGVNASVRAAASGSLITFGIKPDRPATGYGYIKAALSDQSPFSIAKFVEKPSLEAAQDYLSSGNYLWNSGIFLFSGASYRKQLKHYRPDIAAACTDSWAGKTVDSEFFRPDKASFESCPSESIDYAVMESTDDGMVMPIDPGWNDLGSWDALLDLLPKTPQGNVEKGDVISHKSSNNFVYADHKLVSTLGVSNLVIVDTKDALLVAHKDSVEDVRLIVEQLNQDERSETVNHREVFRPWGKYDLMDSSDRFQVKRITVNPGAKLSVQMHHHRAEHWVVVNGTAKVTIDGVDKLVSENESVYIPIGAVHSLENPGQIPIELIEIQTGSYLGEDDIVRFEDRYGRN